MDRINNVIRDVLALADLYRPSWPAIEASIERSGDPTMHTTEKSLRDQLRDSEAQIREQRGELATKQKSLDKAKEEYAKADDKSQEGEAFKTAETALAEHGETKETIESLEGAQQMVLKLLGDRGSDSTPSGNADDPRFDKWDSSKMMDPEIVAELKRLANSKNAVGTREFGEVLSRKGLIESMGRGGGIMATVPEDVDLTGPMRRGPLRAIVPQLRRPLRILDLIPTGTMDLNSFPYVREEGSLRGVAKGVKEGSEKPGGTWKYKDAEAVARTIAEYMKVKKQSLEDVGALRSVMDSRLRYALELALEEQVLIGNGEDPNLDGILPAAGKGVVKYASGELTADQVLRTLTAVLLANATPSGIGMHPLDWADALMAKAKFGTEGGSGEYYGGGPFATTPQTMWGVPLIPSVAIPQSTVLAGDFGIGAQVLYRTGITSLMSDSDGTDFRENRVTLLAEFRATNVIWQPTAFAVAYLTKKAEEEAE